MRRRGFTLLEMLVATSLLAIAVVGMLASLSTSLKNASRVTSQDRAALLASRKLEELLGAPRLPRGVELQGPISAEPGFEGGWRAMVTPFEGPPNVQAGATVLDRVECEVWWMEAGTRRSFRIDGYRTTVLTPEDFLAGAIPR
jgi:general secretion pathway protein I